MVLAHLGTIFLDISRHDHMAEDPDSYGHIPADSGIWLQPGAAENHRSKMGDLDFIQVDVIARQCPSEIL